MSAGKSACCLQRWDVQILVAGGTSEYCANTKSPANNQSYLIDVSLHCTNMLKLLTKLLMVQYIIPFAVT